MSLPTPDSQGIGRFADSTAHGGSWKNLLNKILTEISAALPGQSGHAEFTFATAAVADGRTQITTLTAVSGDTDLSYVTATGSQITLQPGKYVIDVDARTTAATGRTFVEITASNGTTVLKRGVSNGVDEIFGVVLGGYRVTAATAIRVYVFKTTGGSNIISGTVRVTRIGRV